jgi:hypothetical protein
MKVKNVEIRMCPDPTKTRVFINGEEAENLRGFKIEVVDGQSYPTGITLEFEGVNIKMVPLWAQEG